MIDFIEIPAIFIKTLAFETKKSSPKCYLHLFTNSSAHHFIFIHPVHAEDITSTDAEVDATVDAIVLCRWEEDFMETRTVLYFPNDSNGSIKNAIISPFSFTFKAELPSAQRLVYVKSNSKSFSELPSRHGNGVCASRSSIESTMKPVADQKGQQMETMKNFPATSLRL